MTYTRIDEWTPSPARLLRSTPAPPSLLCSTPAPPSVQRSTPSPPSLLGGEGWGEGAAVGENEGHQTIGAIAVNPGAGALLIRSLQRRPLTQPSPPSERWGRGLRLVAWAFASALLFFGFFVPSAHAIDPLPFKDRAEEVRFQHLTRQLRCLVCQNQDLADSDADLAKDLRKQVFDMMRDGKSDDDIKQYLVARYNDFVLYDPPLKPGTWLLWFTPFVLVLIGAFVVGRILRRRSAQAAAQPRRETEAGDDW